MINQELIAPKSIVVVGASNDIEKPGGKLLKNLLDNKFNGDLYVINPKDSIIQGIESYNTVSSLPDVELAIIAVAAKFIPDMMIELAEKKGTKAFIILSAGFSETGVEGKELENKIINICEKYDCSLIGPNCIGLLNVNYAGVFAGPIPRLASNGCDFVSGSGATAVFILENAILMGIPFRSVFSVGNSAIIGVEEVLEYWDLSFDDLTDSKVKLIYIEQVSNPDKFLKHCRSLINKGCRIAGIKAGTTDAGSRAVSSHTGSLAGSDLAVGALFEKAGITRCYSREELVYVAGIFCHPVLENNRLAVVTHAGGPGVMLTDALSKGKMQVPKIEGDSANELLSKLYHGSSVTNPIDFLATGNAVQLESILSYIDNHFDNIDGSVVIFGTPGLFDVKPVYEILDKMMSECKKPIFPVLPSLVQVKEAVDYFLSLGRINFPDEVQLGNALAKVFNTPLPAETEDSSSNEIESEEIRDIIDNSSNGYLTAQLVSKLLDFSGIDRAKEFVVETKGEAIEFAFQLGYPVVMKAVGPLHKSDVGAVILNVKNQDEVEQNFDKLLKIPGSNAVLIQEMASGLELFAGANYEADFGHLVLFGLGGIYIETLKDYVTVLNPVTEKEFFTKLKQLKSYPVLEGIRGKKGININKLFTVVHNLSKLLEIAPEIKEIDLNPLLASEERVLAVDARIRIEK